MHVLVQASTSDGTSSHEAVLNYVTKNRRRLRFTPSSQFTNNDKDLSPPPKPSFGSCAKKTS